MHPVPYLYAVDLPEEIPNEISRDGLETLREAYRTTHQDSFARHPSANGWQQLVGATYRRQIIAIRLRTTDEQDEKVVAWLNQHHNRSHFNLFLSNCPDFARSVLNVLFPGAIHRNILFDAGITTPKQIGSSLHGYAERHPEVGFALFNLPQINSNLRRSGKLYGVTESFVKNKPYLLGLSILQPLGIGCVVASGLLDHRYDVQAAAHQQLLTACPRTESPDDARHTEPSIPR